MVTAQNKRRKKFTLPGMSTLTYPKRPPSLLKSTSTKIQYGVHQNCDLSNCKCLVCDRIVFSAVRLYTIDRLGSPAMHLADKPVGRYYYPERSCGCLRIGSH